MSLTGTLRFYLREEQPNSKGLVKLWLAYQLPPNNKAYFSIGKSLHVENWDRKKQTTIYRKKEHFKGKIPEIHPRFVPSQTDLNEIDKEILSIMKEVEDIENKILKYERSELTVMAVIDQLEELRKPMKKRSGHGGNTVTKLIQQYIDDHKKERVSMAVYGTLISNIEDYEKTKKKKVNFSTVGTYDFFKDFKDYYIESGKISDSTLSKRLTSLKTFLRHAQTVYKRNEIADGFRDFKLTHPNPGFPIFLTNDEFEKLLHFELTPGSTYAHVRDAFCFSVATGYRRSDMNQLKNEHIKDGVIKLVVTKTRENLQVNLTDYSQEILDRYKGQEYPIPLISDQKSNIYIKEICKAAGFTDLQEVITWKGGKRQSETFPKFELITNHVARKTFATLSLERGMPIETVMKIGGWKSFKAFQRYVGVADKRTGTEMTITWKKKPAPVKENQNLTEDEFLRRNSA